MRVPVSRSGLGHPNALGFPNAPRRSASASPCLEHPHRPAAARTRTPASIRSAGLLAALAVLGFAILLSLAVGARSIPLDEVVDALLRPVGDARTPPSSPTCGCRGRCSASLVGVALGLAGALMQALTRNPLADPGLLGVNAGASAAVVTAIGFLGITALDRLRLVRLRRRRDRLRRSSTLIGSDGPRRARRRCGSRSPAPRSTAVLIAYTYAVALSDPRAAAALQPVVRRLARRPRDETSSG